METQKLSKKSSLKKIGYARVSSIGQNLDSQVDTLEKIALLHESKAF